MMGAEYRSGVLSNLATYAFKWWVCHRKAELELSKGYNVTDSHKSCTKKIASMLHPKKDKLQGDSFSHSSLIFTFTQQQVQTSWWNQICCLEFACNCYLARSRQSVTIELFLVLELARLMLLLHLMAYCVATSPASLTKTFTATSALNLTLQSVQRARSVVECALICLDYVDKEQPCYGFEYTSQDCHLYADYYSSTGDGLSVNILYFYLLQCKSCR